MSSFETTSEGAHAVGKSPPPAVLDERTSQCFLCLQEGSLNSQFKTQALQYILEYLGVSRKAIKEIKSEEGYIENPNVFGFLKQKFEYKTIVTLCSSCTAVTTKLSSLIRQLEVIQLWIDYQIQQVQQIFQASENEEMDENLADWDVQQLRTTLKSKCQLEVSKLSSLKVKLERIEVIPTGTNEFEEPSVNSDLEEPAWMPDTDSGRNSTSEDEESNFEEDEILLPKTTAGPTRTVACLPETDSESETTSEEEKSDSLHDKNLRTMFRKVAVVAKLLSKPIKTYLKINPSDKTRYLCLLCKKSFRPTARTPSLYNVVITHVTINHVEEFFMQIKSANVNTGQFAKFCKSAINSEFHQARDPRKTKQFQCPHCAFRCSAFSERTATLHYIKAHYEYIQKKIIELQKSLMTKEPEDVEKELNKMRSRRGRVVGIQNQKSQKDVIFSLCKQFLTKSVDAKKLNCTLCDKPISAKHNKDHLIRRHMETVFAEMRLENVSKSQFQLCCEKFVRSEHEKAKLANHIAKTGHKCPYCNKTIPQYLISLKEHLVLHHFQIVEEHLVRLQTETFQENGCQEKTKVLPVPVSKLTMLLPKPVSEYFKINHPPKGRYLCLLCHQSVMLPFKGATVITLVRNHLTIHHVEEFFVNVRSKNVDIDQFAKYCQHVVRSELSRDGPRDKGKSFNCSYCSFATLATSYKHIRYHLFKSHYNILQQKVTQLQSEMAAKTSKDSEKLLSQPSVGNKLRINCEHWTRFSKESKQFFNHSKCVLCQRKLQKNVLKAHLIQRHPETLFSTAGTWAKAANKEQFHKLCMHVMQSEVDLMKQMKRKEARTTRIQYECHICTDGNKSMGDGFVKYHLATRHFNILREKLHVFDQDKNFDISSLQTKAGKLRKRVRKKKRKQVRNGAKRKNGGTAKPVADNIKRVKLEECLVEREMEFEMSQKSDLCGETLPTHDHVVCASSTTEDYDSVKLEAVTND